MKVLFITSTRIGDAVLSTSVLNYIIKIHPSSSIYLATGEDPSSLFKDFQNVKKIYILKKKRFNLPHKFFIFLLFKEFRIFLVSFISFDEPKKTIVAFFPKLLFFKSN